MEIFVYKKVMSNWGAYYHRWWSLSRYKSFRWRAGDDSSFLVLQTLLVGGVTILLYWNFSKFRSPKCHHIQQQQIRMFWNGTWPFLLTQKSCWSISGSMEQERGSVLNARPWTLNPRAQKVNMSLCIDFYCDLLVPREILSIWSKIYSSMAMNYKLFFCALSMGIWNWSALHHDL